MTYVHNAVVKQLIVKDGKVTKIKISIYASVHDLFNIDFFPKVFLSIEDSVVCECV